MTILYYEVILAFSVQICMVSYTVDHSAIYVQ